MQRENEFSEQVEQPDKEMVPAEWELDSDEARPNLEFDDFRCERICWFIIIVCFLIMVGLVLFSQPGENSKPSNEEEATTEQVEVHEPTGL